MRLLTLILFTAFHILAELRANVTRSEGRLLWLREVPILLFNQQSQPCFPINTYCIKITLSAVDIILSPISFAQRGVEKVMCSNLERKLQIPNQ